jgi:hypothetical protein
MKRERGRRCNDNCTVPSYLAGRCLRGRERLLTFDWTIDKPTAK